MAELLNLCDHLTDEGAAMFAGDTDEVIIVHNAPLVVGERFGDLEIVRASSKAEFLWRCPHVPQLTGIDRYYFYYAIPGRQ